MLPYIAAPWILWGIATPKNPMSPAIHSRRRTQTKPLGGLISLFFWLLELTGGDEPPAKSKKMMNPKMIQPPTRSMVNWWFALVVLILGDAFLGNPEFANPHPILYYTFGQPHVEGTQTNIYNIICMYTSTAYIHIDVYK